MPTKRSKPRKSSVIKQKHRFKKGYTHHIVPVKYKVTTPLSLEHRAFGVRHWLLQQDWLEQQVIPVLDTFAVPSDMREHYLSFARRKWSIGNRFTSNTRQDEYTSLHNEFALRGLNPAILNQIQVVMPHAAVWILGHSRLGIETRLA